MKDRYYYVSYTAKKKDRIFNGSAWVVANDNPLHLDTFAEAQKKENGYESVVVLYFKEVSGDTFFFNNPGRS